MRSLGIRRLDFVTIYSGDLTASRRFYVDVLGFRLVREIANEFFQIEVAGVPICVDLDEQKKQRNNIGLEVDDLRATEGVLREKGLSVKRGANAMEKWLSVEDPDGNELVFLTRPNAASGMPAP